MTTGTRSKRTGADVIMAILGAVLAAAPWAYEPTFGIATWSAGVLGLAMVATALTRVDGAGRGSDAGLLSLGVAAVLSPSLLGFWQSANVAGMHVLVGIAVAALACLQLAVRTFDPGVLDEVSSGASADHPLARDAAMVSRSLREDRERPQRVPEQSGSVSTRPSREAPQRAVDVTFA